MEILGRRVALTQGEETLATCKFKEFFEFDVSIAVNIAHSDHFVDFFLSGFFPNQVEVKGEILRCQCSILVQV